MTTVLNRIGEWVAGSENSSLSQPTREKLAIHLLDTIGAWLTGRASDEGAMLMRLKTSRGVAFPLFGAEPLDRIALSVAFTRLTEIDDIHMSSCTTPSSVIIPTALTVAARLQRPPNSNAFAQALCAGYEVITRLGTAIAGPSILYRGIWPTYFTTPAGSAAVTARLIGLDARQTGNAIGIALALTSGSPGAPTAPSPRWLMLGLAARSGCSAALAAAEGYVADQQLLDDDWMARTHGIPCDTAPLVSEIQEGGAVSALSLKSYCAAKQTIAAIEALRNLLEQGIAPDDLASLRVAVPPFYAGMIGHDQAAAGRSGRITSAKYNLALAAYRPGGLNDVARPDLTEDLQIANFMKRVEVVSDASLSRHYPQRWPARIEVTLKDGRSVSSLVLDAPGDPLRAFDVSQARRKFHRFVDRVIGKLAADEIAECCLAAIEQDDALATLCARFVWNGEYFA